MDINEAANQIEQFFEDFRDRHDDWNPTEIRVLPSGDDMEAIKIFFNFGTDVDDADIAPLRDRAMSALEKDRPDLVDAYELEVRADAM